jgi:hypothetical protein
MAIKKEQYIEAIEDINNREIFEEEIPIDLTIQKFKKIMCEVATSIDDEDEISKETGELIMALGYKLPRPLHTYTRKNPEPLPQVDVATDIEYKLLPINWVWFWNDDKWVLQQHPGIQLAQYPQVKLFYIQNPNNICFYEAVGSSLIFKSHFNDINDAIGEFMAHVENLKSLPRYVHKLMRKNLKRRTPKYRKTKVRKVFLKTKDKDGNIVWKLEEGQLIKARGGWKDFIFYLIKNSENVATIGELLIIEALSGDIIFAGTDKKRIEHDFYTYLATQDPDAFKQIIGNSIEKDGASPFYPGIHKFQSLEKTQEDIKKTRKRTEKGVNDHIVELMVKNPEITPQDVFDKLIDRGFTGLKLANIKNYVYRQRKIIRKVVGL